MFKKLLTLAAVTVAAAVPAVAGTAHDFDPGLVSRSSRATLDGQCYTTQGDSKVCFFRVNGETYNVAISQAMNPEFPHIFTINCDTGRYKDFGPMDNNENARFAQAFCDSGRY